jgi:hypothetical protein
MDRSDRGCLTEPAHAEPLRLQQVNLSIPPKHCLELAVSGPVLSSEGSPRLTQSVSRAVGQPCILAPTPELVAEPVGRERLEDEFGVELSEVEQSLIETVNDLIECVKSHSKP